MEDIEFNRRLNRTVGTAVAALVGIGLLWYFGYLFILIFTGVLLGLLLQTLTDALAERLPLRRGFSYTAVLVVFFSVLGGVVLLFGPLFAQGLNELFEFLTKAIDDISAWLQQHRWSNILMPGGEGGGGDLGAAFSAVAGYFSTALWVVTAGLIILIVAIYLASEPRTYIHGTVLLLPARHRETGRDILGEIGTALRWWLIGRFASMALVGVLTWIGLLIIGMPLAATLAVLAALLSFIPNIGPVLSALPAVLIGFQQSQTMALYVIILYVVVQTVESYLITPLIQQRAVALPPALVIAVQLLGATAYGLLGILVATPLTVAAVVALRKLYIEPPPAKP